jgi:hypothetical protein
VICTPTVLPLSRLVTRARVPRGKVGWAAVSPCRLNRVPLAVGRP